MANQPLLTREIQGLLPALEAKNVNKPFVIDGRNFIVDFEGPYSAFSSLLASYNPFSEPALVETFEVEGHTFIFSAIGIFEYDVTSQMYQPLYIFNSPVTSYWPWSAEKIGTVWYFCRKDVGIVRFDPTFWAFSILVASELPADPRSICKSYGRLIVLGATRVAWSDLDNGDVFDSSLATGTGSQGTSAYAPGNPLVVKETADGFIYFSDKAIGKGQIIEIETTFRHFNISREYKLINPFAIATTDDLTHVFVTKQGLVSTNGQVPKPWQELFSQHLIRNVFPSLDSLSLPTIKLYHDDDRDWFFISIASKDSPSLYGMAYALNLKRGEGGWGRFDKLHYSFGKFNLNPSDPSALFNLGYICKRGFIHKFVTLAYTEEEDYISDYYFYQSFSNFPATFEGSTWVPKSLMKMTSVNEAALINAVSGLYDFSTAAPAMEPTLPIDESSYAVVNNVESEDWLVSLLPDEDWLVDVGDEDWMTGDFAAIFPCLIGMADTFTRQTVEAAPLIKSPINGYIDVGFFRLPIVESGDEMTLITELAIGMFNSNDFGGAEDWLNAPTEDVDWMTATGIEDWGYGIPTEVGYKLTLIASNDGETTFSQQDPTMSTNAGAVQYYKPFLTGIFHKVRVAANEADEAFHLKFLELSGSKAGRL